MSLSSLHIKRSSPALSLFTLVCFLNPPRNLESFQSLSSLQSSAAYGFGFSVQSAKSIIISYLCPCTALEKMLGEAPQNNWRYGVFTVKSQALLDIWAQQQQQKNEQKWSKIAAVLLVNGRGEIHRVVFVVLEQYFCWGQTRVIRCNPYQAVLLWLNLFIRFPLIYAKGEHLDGVDLHWVYSCGRESPKTLSPITQGFMAREQ